MLWGMVRQGKARYEGVEYMYIWMDGCGVVK